MNCFLELEKRLLELEMLRVTVYDVLLSKHAFSNIRPSSLSYHFSMVFWGAFAALLYRSVEKDSVWQWGCQPGELKWHPSSIRQLPNVYFHLTRGLIEGLTHGIHFPLWINLQLVEGYNKNQQGRKHFITSFHIDVSRLLCFKWKKTGT